MGLPPRIGAGGEILMDGVIDRGPAKARVSVGQRWVDTN
jgi:hypothetical protein